MLLVESNFMINAGIPRPITTSEMKSVLEDVEYIRLRADFGQVRCFQIA